MQTDTADETLERILRAIERSERKEWVEVFCAVVLSLATIGSAWCAYQATLWDGTQTIRLTEASQSERTAAALSIEALQQRTFDASMFIDFMRAATENNEKLEAFLHERFRPEARKAVDAWLRTAPFENGSAPLHPFLMPEYVQQTALDAQVKQGEAAELRAAAAQANEFSDRYVLLTVVFASVLFFGGMGGTLKSPRIRIALGVAALLLFAATMIALAAMPVCHG